MGEHKNAFYKIKRSPGVERWNETTYDKPVIIFTWLIFETGHRIILISSKTNFEPTSNRIC